MKKILIVALAVWFLPVSLAYADISAPLKPIKILIVPGHDKEVWGAQYGTLKEADMTLALSTELYDILSKDDRFQVFITRDREGYTKTFADYFAAEKTAIIDFADNSKKLQDQKIKSGSFITKITVPHNRARTEVALELFGINKWADDNKMDAVIHVHFNDYRRPNIWTIGRYIGFTVYMPDPQLPNADKSEMLARKIWSALKGKYSTSTNPLEKGGLITDQKLIALGSDGTLNPTVESVLIEYGYIYQKMFRSKTTRLAAYKDMSELTAGAIQDYFFK